MALSISGRLLVAFTSKPLITKVLRKYFYEPSFYSRNRDSNFGHLCEPFYCTRIVCINTFSNHRDTMATATATSRLEQQILGPRLASLYGDLDSVSRLSQIRLNAATLIILDQKWSERIIDAIVTAWVSAKVSILNGLILREVEMGHGDRRSPFSHQCGSFCGLRVQYLLVFVLCLASQRQLLATNGMFFDENFYLIYLNRLCTHHWCSAPNF